MYKKMWKKIWHVISHFFQYLGIILVLIGAWFGAMFILRGIYHFTGAPSSAYVSQVINLVVGFHLFFITIMLVGQIYRKREIAKLKRIIEAMRRIAKGDFSVQLDESEEYREFKQIVESINEMAGELSQMEMMRQDFISNVSHEIQSPLTSIRGFTEALRSSQLKEEQRRHYLDIIESESRRLSQMSDNMLKLSSLESDRSSFEHSKFRLDRQLQSIVLATEPQWLAKQIEIELDLKEIYVEGVEELLSQVWVNLLNNSIKFTSVKGRIWVKLTTGDEGAKVIIADSGVGISKEDIPYIFDRFYKADKSRNRDAGGSGLGLSIVRKIVDIHQGQISVESQPDQGTQFTVFIPIQWK
ncbi:HAMP domain-containing sensor histidine kinase [Paenibacillus sp. D2_2]|uniref:sensor histidine kinase n=1 Tax=Paenibacillus sp. D2_2 TaxID=3073092 RepID=UPI0028166412|nr:HAMP domain-containing sensor histidine kinase [Paenibacillus sp. D2_2]WMT39063.1 HAMP domain-containing sensor histidine kinase [Paenibacillus sp. D2_2]